MANIKTNAVVGLVVLMAIQTHSWLVKPENVTDEIDGNMYCDYNYLNSRYMNTSKYFNKFARAEFANECKPLNLNCTNILFILVFAVNEQNSLFFNYDFTGITFPEGCLGYMLQVSGKKENTYFMYLDKYKLQNTKVHINVSHGTEYSFKMFSLPSTSEETINGQEITLKTPDKCQVDMFDRIDNFPPLISDKCDGNKEYSAYREKYHITAQLCKEFPYSIKKRLNGLNDVRQIGCHYVYLVKSPQKESNQKTLLVLFIFLTVFCMLLILLFVRYKVCRNKKLEFSSCISSSSSDVNSPSTKTQIVQKNNKDNEICKKNSIMILNRPGCELLEAFLRDLAFILSLHGIEVKMALLEQTRLDSEGGISSYIQRNIKSCTHILITCSEKAEDTPLPKHRPFEFALQILSGLAFHKNDSSRYIPIYFRPYAEILSILPSFLVSCRHTGYLLPDEIDKIITFINNTRDGVNLPNVEEVKKQFIVNRMKSVALKILEESHPNCNGDKCRKGQVSTSKSNLSSIWPSTINSGWPSYKSVDKQADEFYLEGKMELLHFRPNNYHLSIKSQSYDNLLIPRSYEHL